MTKKWTATKSLFLSRMLTIATLVLAIAALFCIPVIAKWYDMLSGKTELFAVMTVGLYISDGLAIVALLQLHKLLRNIHAQRVFVQENAACFRLISWCCFGVAAVWLFLTFWQFLYLTFWRFVAFLIAFMAAFAGLVIRVIKNLLEAAVELREENDYTI
ncbi:MAG: DUF2975 domain-containing protein [Oscillospiraceae bacterium]|nr:DUF2975 domain-containing protein [Oscillospiraceae bacterium]